MRMWLPSLAERISRPLPRGTRICPEPLSRKIEHGDVGRRIVRVLRAVLEHDEQGFGARRFAGPGGSVGPENRGGERNVGE
jgi:hypothetical protein